MYILEDENCDFKWKMTSAYNLQYFVRRGRMLLYFPCLPPTVQPFFKNHITVTLLYFEIESQHMSIAASMPL